MPRQAPSRRRGEPKYTARKRWKATGLCQNCGRKKTSSDPLCGECRAKKYKKKTGRYW